MLKVVNGDMAVLLHRCLCVKSSFLVVRERVAGDFAEYDLVVADVAGVPVAASVVEHVAGHVAEPVVVGVAAVGTRFGAHRVLLDLEVLVWLVAFVAAVVAVCTRLPPPTTLLTSILNTARSSSSGHRM